MSRNEIARDAFYGNNESLMQHLNDLDSYKHYDGQTYSSNGMSLDRAIALVEGLTSDEIEMLEAVGIWNY